VPVSVVAFGAEALQTRNITSEQDMGSLVPGLQVKNGQNSNQLSFAMRGQTLDPFSGTSPAVLTYLNEAPYNPGNTSTAFFDLGSIQVLKGPQGTLFGRNATGGAVLYSTPIPGKEFAGYVTVRGASRNYIQLQGAMDLPLAPGLLAVRLAFDATRGDGYIKNLNTGNTLGDKNSRSGRATILFTPTDTIKNVTVLQYDHVRGTEGAGGIWTYNSLPSCTPGPCTSAQLANGQFTQFNSDGTTHTITHNPGDPGAPLASTLAALYGANNGPVAPGFFPGAVEGYTQFSHANPYKVWLQYDLPHRATNFFASNTTELALGANTKLKNIFSYMKGKAVTPGNLAGGPFGALWLFNLGGINRTGTPGGESFHSSIYSDELQIQGKALDNRLNYTAGVFYSNQHRFEIIPISIGADLSFGPLADISYAYRNRETSKAIFAQGSYQLTDKLTATLGGRYTWESIGIAQAPGNLFDFVNSFGTIVYNTAPQSKKLSAPAWTASVQYQITPNHMVYASQRGSFRSGNFNGTVTPGGDNYFGNENVHDFEVGYKFSGRIGRAPAQFNIAAYDVIVKHAQHALYAIVGGQPAGFTVSVPEAKVKGVEVDANIGLTDWLDVGFNMAYTDARYTKGLVTPPGAASIRLDSYPDSPKWSGSANATLKFPVPANIGKMDLRADFYGQTHTFFSSTNGTATPGTRLAGYKTLGVRFGWKDIMQSRVSAALYARNLTKKLYYVAGYALGASSGLNTAYPGEPRTFGAELSVKF